MTVSRVNRRAIFALLAFLALPAGAQTPAPQPPSDHIPEDRDASFLPPGRPVPLVPQPNPATASLPPIPPTNTPPVLSLPSAVSAPPVEFGDNMQKPLELAKPVESGALQNIDPDAIGLLAPESGGLGAAMWMGTPRELVDRMLPVLSLPNASPALNNVAKRFLLTTANVPQGGAAGGESLTSMRVGKLLALGDAADAWDLALLAKPDQVGDVTLRAVAEAALASGEGKNVCSKLPEIIQSHISPEWQKLLVVCQLRDNDAKAAQLELEVLHTQNVKDDLFFALAEHNVIGGDKSLPRQLTPLKPLDLALLQIVGQPLPSEVYAHPDAAVIPGLLQMKTHEDSMRLGLAERAAARGLINGPQLAEVYRSLVFAPDQIAKAIDSPENSASRRALLYQAALTERTPERHLDAAEKFVESLDAAVLNGATAQVLVDMTANIAPTNVYARWSPVLAYIYIMADKPKEALGWLKLARQAAASMPTVAAPLQNSWPLVVLSGLETDGDYGQTFGTWLTAALKNADRAKREQIGGILLLFDAAGFAVPAEAWAHVADLAAGEKHILPPSALLLERLRAAGVANRRGEAVLLAIAIAGANTNESSLLPVIDTVRALRLVGLTADALALARETAAALLGLSGTAVNP